MESVEIGVMLPGARRFTNENINPTWKAHVKTHTGVLVAYVKRIPPRKIYIECVCALLGRLLDLPIPKPIIVKVTAENFSDIPEDKFALAFGSEDVGYPSFRRYIQNEEAWNKLKEFSKTADIGLFDEWIANWDRNIGNFLYDGSKNFSFIDHENALDPQLKVDEAARDNQILSVIFAVQSEFEKHKLIRNAQASFIPQYGEIPLSLLSEKAHAGSYLTDEEILSVINFLGKRIEHLDMLFSKRLSIKQQKLAI